MAVKFLYYFLSTFFVVAIFLFYQKPYDLKVSKKNQKKPNIEVIDMVNYTLNKDGVSRVVKVKKVLRFATHDEFYGIDAIKKSKDTLLENLQAGSAKLIGDDLSFKGDVRYINSNDVKFRSEQADYNLKTKVFKSDVDFVLEDKRTVTYGSSMIYKSIEGKIYANNIKSKTEVDSK